MTGGCVDGGGGTNLAHDVVVRREVRGAVLAGPYLGAREVDFEDHAHGWSRKYTARWLPSSFTKTVAGGGQWMQMLGGRVFCKYCLLSTAQAALVAVDDQVAGFAY